MKEEKLKLLKEVLYRIARAEGDYRLEWKPYDVKDIIKNMMKEIEDTCECGGELGRVAVGDETATKCNGCGAVRAGG